MTTLYAAPSERQVERFGTLVNLQLSFPNEQLQ
jgi:hypothetical protein